MRSKPNCALAENAKKEMLSMKNRFNIRGNSCDSGSSSTYYNVKKNQKVE